MLNEIMSKNIIYGNINDSFKDISKLMKKHNIGFIPIKDDNNYVGVITDRDICLAISSIKSTSDPIKDYITNNIISIDVKSNIDDALDKMGKYKIKRLLNTEQKIQKYIVKEKDNIVGILSLSDILEFSNDDNLIYTFKTIFYIHDNDHLNTAEIDEFYL